MSEIEELKARIARLEKATTNHQFEFPEAYNLMMQQVSAQAQTLQPMPKCGLCGRDYNDSLHHSGFSQQRAYPLP